METYYLADLQAAARDDQESRDYCPSFIDGSQRRRKRRTKARRRSYANRRAIRFARRAWEGGAVC